MSYSVVILKSQGWNVEKQFVEKKKKFKALAHYEKGQNAEIDLNLTLQT